MKPRSRFNEVKTVNRRVLPTWAAFAIVISISLMLCLSINYRSFSAMHEEVSENDQLTTRIQSITDENLQLQEEIHSLKSDARVIQREAQRLGIVRTNRVSVPTN
ncbi:MAG: hypothetical protein ABJA02_03800 [Acidobacteriota bacterium]